MQKYILFQVNESQISSTRFCYWYISSAKLWYILLVPLILTFLVKNMTDLETLQIRDMCDKIIYFAQNEFHDL